MNEKSKENRILGGGQLSKKIIPIVIVLLVFTLTITYAYFTAQNDIGELESNALEQQTATLNGTQLTLAGETLKAESDNVYPGHKEIVKLTVSALHDNGPVNYNLEWVGTNSLTSEVTYKIYKSEQNLEPKITCNTVSIPGQDEIHYYEECNISEFGTLESDGAYKEGIIEHADIETTQGLLYYEEITGNEEPKKVYYYVVIEYPNDPDNPQNDDAGNGYKGSFKLNIGTKTKKINTSIGLLDINLDTPNFSNRSCLEGTNVGLWQNGCEESTNGIYEETTSLGTTYYYRGTINNNWVKYGTNENEESIWWRIIRINEDETIRLLYAGEGEEAPASKDEINGQSGYWVIKDNYGIYNQGYSFNNLNNPVAYVSYMYGTPEDESPEKEYGYDLIDAGTPELLQSSEIKKVIDDWYVKNLADEGEVLSGATGFCGDRNFEVISDMLYEYTYYKAYNRIWENHKPSFECEDSKYDLYTTKSDKGNGNGALDYPIGLITADEASYAGLIKFNSVREGDDNSNRGNWLSTNRDFWTISPYGSDQFNRAYMNCGISYFIGSSTISVTAGVRPVVNILPTYFKTEGHDGTIENPYVVEI